VVERVTNVEMIFLYQWRVRVGRSMEVTGQNAAGR
jgi:hypothetical protein